MRIVHNSFMTLLMTCFLCMTCLCLVHYLFTTYSWLVHDLFMNFAWFVSDLFTGIWQFSVLKAPLTQIILFAGIIMTGWCVNNLIIMSCGDLLRWQNIFPTNNINYVQIINKTSSIKEMTWKRKDLVCQWSIFIAQEA